MYENQNILAYSNIGLIIMGLGHDLRFLCKKDFIDSALLVIFLIWVDYVNLLVIFIPRYFDDTSLPSLYKTNSRRFITNKVAHMACIVLTPHDAKEPLWYAKCARPYFSRLHTKRKRGGYFYGPVS